jgi:ElaB/YqjD/DUF883 family membrane-anchored ribosome-binding protein
LSHRADRSLAAVGAPSQVVHGSILIRRLKGEFMPTRGIGRRRSHARHAAQTPIESLRVAANDEARILVAEVEDLIERLGTAAEPEVAQLRKRAEAALDRAKAAVAEEGAQVQAKIGDLARVGDGHTRHWALLSVAAVCAIVIGVWTGRAVMTE